eukprot:6196735-Pleurochrysis_carterae.AAC.2
MLPALLVLALLLWCRWAGTELAMATSMAMERQWRTILLVMTDLTCTHRAASIWQSCHPTGLFPPDTHGGLIAVLVRACRQPCGGSKPGKIMQWAEIHEVGTKCRLTGRHTTSRPWEVSSSRASRAAVRRVTLRRHASWCSQKSRLACRTGSGSNRARSESACVSDEPSENDPASRHVGLPDT